ncbi:maleylpyruvate isomerase N-terminal domain-containing protein [Kutzneria sp. CA-103260]|uniref:maleylpyruvate isomerase N-terminal domain-containing protein n=1 Tax=Kutzneria sp. CA-103260 TaxID=2802641 RepID=UPI001BABB87C|nr:maleylpyruvate isomerase N-terminal domain-containing protein [Kutzneria sp. CA-103260]QUQ66169.1 maleylpyruvate isomerase family mycothiol-dependent enzyme [Kutzneria sp. CA-103260]
MDFERQRAEIVTQTELLAADVAGADLTARVPSCPDWSLGGLLRHLGGAHAWIEEIVRTRAEGPVPDPSRDVNGDDSGEPPVEWLLDGARRLAASIRDAGPDTVVWTPLAPMPVSFFARRMVHETLVHRADAMLAAGQPFTAEPEVVVDAVDEWMELDALPQHFEFNPAKRDLLGRGRTLSFRATDADVAWQVDLTGDAIVNQRGRADAAVTVEAPLTDLLLIIYRRREPTGVTGDADLLAFWSKHVTFG